MAEQSKQHCTYGCLLSTSLAVLQCGGNEWGEEVMAGVEGREGSGKAHLAM